MGIRFSCAQARSTSYYKEKSIVQKSKIALELWGYYSRYHIDSLNIIGIDLLQKHHQSKDLFSKAVSYRMLGCYDVRSGAIHKGLELLNSSKNILLNLGDEKLISEAYNEIGIAYLLLGDHKTANVAFEKSLSHGRNSNSPSMSYMAEINLAKSELKAGNMIPAKMLAEHYIRMALNDEKYESAANAYSFLGQIALDENKIERAKSCFNKQFEFAQLCVAPFIVTRAINNRAIRHFISSEYDESLKLFQEVLAQRKSQNFHFYTCEAYMNIANYYLETNDQIKGSLYIDSCISLAEEHNLLLNQIEAIELMIEHQETPDLIKRLGLLKQKQNLMTESNLDARKKLNYKTSKVESQNIYLILILAITSFMIWGLYSKS